MNLAIIPDFREEGWPSMDLVAEMLLSNLDSQTAKLARPQYKRLLGLRNPDRLFNRFVNYPRWLRKQRDSFDCFHICDHSYAQLVHELPGERAGVFCHDLDTFRCLIEPHRDPRPPWFRAMARRILSGMQRAAVVFHSTRAVRDEILKHNLIDAARLVQAPCGVAPEFCPTGASVPLPPTVPPSFVLHVGSCIPRKRLDVLIDAIAAAKSARLVQVGGTWTAAQQQQIQDRGISNRIVQIPKQDRPMLAGLYRRADALVITSDAEGFGLPVIEALACGTPVIASDIPALREVGGDTVVFSPTGNADAFSRAIEALNPSSVPERAARIAQAARFSWQNHARVILDAYQALMRGQSR